MEVCRHLGPLINTGDHDDVYHCAQFGACTLVKTELRRLDESPMPWCSLECSGYCEAVGSADSSPILPADSLGCPLRAEAIGVIRADGCNCDKTIYRCGLHGKCLKRLPSTVRSRDRLGEQLDGVRLCAEECSDWMPPERHIYRSFADEARDARLWASELPDDIIGFCGVHRSGVAIAAAMATIRNLHYVDFEALRQNVVTWHQPIRRRFGTTPPLDGRILVVDDTCMSGGTMRDSIKPALAGCRFPLAFGALYYGAAGRAEIDYGFKEHFHIRQTFESNLFHDWWAHSQSFDLDGVFCSDCPSNEIDVDEPRYLEWMATVRPLVIPTRPVGQIVTGRLEKYRPQTEAWLARHGIRFNRLVMYADAETNAERNAKHDTVPAFKARAYRRKSDSTLFVESDIHQAARIAELTGKSVLAWPGQQTWNCD